MELPGIMGNLEEAERRTFEYFWAFQTGGLVQDNALDTTYSSVAGMGFGIMAYIIGAERRYISRRAAAAWVLTVLELFEGVENIHGFFPHFLETSTGGAWRDCELSTVDTALFLMGAVAAMEYFDRDEEIEIRACAARLYARVDWREALNSDGALSHGWREGRRISYSYKGYNEALFMYLLALGAPNMSVPEETYGAWMATYKWTKIYGYEYLYGGPLFLHQTTQSLIDCRGIQDSFMRGRGIDYFENSRRATLVQREYGIRQGARHGYGAFCWGLTANEGPGGTNTVGVKTHRLARYRARGVPYGPDDGTMAPWAMVASLPFAPEIVGEAMVEMEKLYPQVVGSYGYKCAFHPSMNNNQGWVCDNYFAIDQGGVLLMLENYRSGLIWRLIGKSAYIQRGLRRAGFKGGWLDI